VRYDTAIDDSPEFDALVRPVTPNALRLATVVLGSRDGADDVVQVAMTRAWSSFDRYDPDRPFLPWFLRIVANTARNDRRQRGRRAALALRLGLPGEEPSAEEGAMAELDRTHVLAALNTLDVDDRTVIALRYFDQLGEAEMAEVMDCAPGTVKSRLNRARRRLRDHLEAGDG